MVQPPPTKKWWQHILNFTVTHQEGDQSALTRMTELVTLVEKLHTLHPENIEISPNGNISTTITGHGSLDLKANNASLLAVLRILEEQLGLKERTFTPGTGTFEQRLNRLKSQTS
jgi:hypothetical protein